MEKESSDNSNQLVKKDTSIKECLDAYIKHKFVSLAAAELGIRPDTLREKLKREARNAGFSDIRMLYGGSEQRSNITQKHLMELIKSQQYRCALSGVELTPEIATLDHVVPVSKGGQHDPENVMWVHSEINRMKGNLSVEEFKALCQKVVQYTR